MNQVLLTFVGDVPKILGGTSEGSEDLQHYRVYEPPFHLGCVRDLRSCNAKGQFLFLYTSSHCTGSSGIEPEPIIGFLIGTQRNGLSDNTHSTAG